MCRRHLSRRTRGRYHRRPCAPFHPAWKCSATAGAGTMFYRPRQPLRRVRHDKPKKSSNADNQYVLQTYAAAGSRWPMGHGRAAASTPRARTLSGFHLRHRRQLAWATVTLPGCRPSAARLPRWQHTSNLFYTAPCGRLAKKLCRRTGMDARFLWQLRRRGQRGR